jgi:flavodoxin
MKKLIIYFSKTGNTQKLANAISAVFANKKIDHDIRKINDLKPEDMGKYDSVFLGTPCYSSDVPKKVRDFLKTLSDSPGTKVFMFVTHSTDDKGPQYEKWAKGCEKTFKEFINGKNILGFFHCKAKPDFMINLFIRFAVFKKDKPGWMDFKKDLYKRPDKNDLANLESLVTL